MAELSNFAFARLGGGSVSREVVTARLVRAIESYWADREDDRSGWVYPAVFQELPPGDTERVELTLDEAMLEGLESEARKRAVSVSDLIGHAASYYLAQVDAGRSGFEIPA